MNNKDNYQGTEIAIIGMSGRFPAADSIEKFWQNLVEGKESIQNFTDQELLENGVSPDDIQNPNYIKAKAQIDNYDMFDALFFGYSPKEAEFIEPQQRLFLESAWEALENAGYNQDNYNGLIGVFAGEGFNSYYTNNILSNLHISQALGNYQSTISNYVDFLCTRVSYKLNLRGPSLTIQTACSTSLSAIHYACQSLLLRECDMALAGGVKLIIPRNTGYLYSVGGITSKDGHCRAFDKDSGGIVPGEGLGIVVLKRLEDALKDRDNIWSIIKGSAINNDGSLKVGYTAPSIEGQTKVIVEAQSIAGVEAESITYVETHGTGTKLGDPIEIQALTTAFNTDKRNYCSIGSVKTNIGHIDSAAGVAGLIKTSLMLKYKKIVPSLHFKEPNPQIDFTNSPFKVNAELRNWESDIFPRRAAVSSFGIGGTNVHIILEEAPETDLPTESRNNKIIMLSAKTELSLKNASVKLAAFLEDNQSLNIDDVAYTLQVGRKSFNNRQAFVCSDLKEAIKKLNNSVISHKIYDEKFNVVFMFPGQGAQYINMAFDLYQTESYFKQTIDNCFNIIKPLVDFDLKSILFTQDTVSKDINQTENTQPLLFIIEYALAKLLIQWGITPNSMIGHSIGEYVAACLSGVFSLEDALKLVVLRGKLMQEVQPGAMLSVALQEEQLIQLIDNETSLAAINTKENCVVSGTHDAIKKLENNLIERNIACRNLETSHAFHSFMMDPILSRFEEEVKRVKMNPPSIPYISNISGNWITSEQVNSVSYWSKHLRNSVRFYDGMLELQKQDNTIFIEVGPGKTLSSFCNQISNKEANTKSINLLRHPNEKVADDYFLISKICELWLNGIEINWELYYNEEKRNKIPLPGYQFDRKKYWIDAQQQPKSESKLTTDFIKNNDITDWFFTPVWEQSYIKEYGINQEKRLLIFLDNTKICNQIKNFLDQLNYPIVTVYIGKEFARKSSNEFSIDASKDDGYSKLFQNLKEDNILPDIILHLWNVSKIESTNLVEKNDGIQNIGLYSLLNISKALGYNNINREISIEVITNTIQSITGDEVINPLCSTLLGAIKIIPLEYLNIKCRNIDISIDSDLNIDERLIGQLINEINSETVESNIVGYRGGYRWVLNYKPIKIEAPKTNSLPFKQGGVYLVTGGFGGMGFTIVEHLAKNYKAKIILIGRSPFPIRDKWDEYLSNNTSNDKITSRIQKLRELESIGAQINVYSADISNIEQMSKIIHAEEKKLGYINGVLHTAGIADYEGIIQLRSKEQTEKVLNPKVLGTVVLDSIIKKNKLDFFTCFSSLGNQLYIVKSGQVGYNAANEFLDAFAHYKTKIRTNNNKTIFKTINWTDWLEVGMTIEAVKRKRKEEEIDFNSILKEAISPKEGIEVLNRVLSSNLSQIIISTSNLDRYIAQLVEKRKEVTDTTIVVFNNLNKQQSRPDLPQTYQAPQSELEKKITKIYEDFLGYNQLGVNDDFFALGGDSLKAVVLAAQISKKLKTEVSIVTLLNNPTIKGIAETIEGLELHEVHEISNTIEKFYFGEKGKELFGAFHNIQNNVERKKIGVVVCMPIGQEHILSYNASIKLAGSLINNGFPVLRFDFLGTGDSDCIIESMTIDDWIINIRTAIKELKSKSNVEQICIIGIRFGATLASLFSAIEHEINRLVLWAPIINGNKYILELENQHKKWLSGSFSSKTKISKNSEEYLGFLYSKQLISEIKKIDLLQLSIDHPANLLIIHNNEFENSQLKKIGKLNIEIQNIESTGHKFWLKQDDEKAKRMIPEQDIQVINKWLLEELIK